MGDGCEQISCSKYRTVNGVALYSFDGCNKASEDVGGIPICYIVGLL